MKMKKNFHLSKVNQKILVFNKIVIQISVLALHFYKNYCHQMKSKVKDKNLNLLLKRIRGKKNKMKISK